MSRLITGKDKWELECVIGIPLFVEDIIDICLVALRERREDVFSKSRKQDLVLSRNIIYLILRSNDVSRNHIADIFGKDHASILHGLKSIKDQMDIDLHTRQTVMEIVKKIKEYAQITGAAK